MFLMEPLIGEVVSVLVSRAEGRDSNPVRDTSTHPAVELSTRLLLELGMKRLPGVMLTTLPSSVLTGPGKYGH